ncbi:Rhodanese domain-containing protein [Mycena indigotica]|uniref:Rhodanese domain-containing protein n=1 Tax=Mycena indigotica TaxID=2126181 RepID=A0A8H6W4G1_9AGAR|nr:Rhodanese domain-containing protein [Mycena indigotica]KAF7298914.1 Rhodanese domain-containing protein [Mycena indigotica]
MHIHLSIVFLLSAALTSTAYQIVDDFSGIGFFDEGNWDFYGTLNPFATMIILRWVIMFLGQNFVSLLQGDVIWLNEVDAYTQQLAYVNAAGNVILRVDDFTNVPFNQKRNSVRITTRRSYELGSLWIIDAVHLPYGCSTKVWPSIWTLGPDWPNGGEIDIVEGINLMLDNQYALHTTAGCFHTTPSSQTGVSSVNDCSNPAGCLVGENAPNSYQSGFAAAGGGVWAAQFDYTGIFIWFWSRPNVPASILQSTATSSMDLSDWGPPSASYVNKTCKIEDFFGPQKLVIDITLCGQWAGIPADYLETCAAKGPTGICYNDNVVGSGANFDQAYFELKHVRAYTTAGPGPSAAVAALGSHSGSYNPHMNLWWATILAHISLGIILVLLR